ncbi:MAG: phenylacetate-CoA ligase, partial [Pseudonocardiales bacterium]|nr:phenylacetate-CoA ligase [Pseudonocardiales bacterium]
IYTKLNKQSMQNIRNLKLHLTLLLPGSARPGMRRMQKITGRSDDMIILRGDNVFPTQIEEIVLRTPGLSPHFQLVLTAAARMDALTVRVESRPDTPLDRRAPAAAEVVRAVKETVGVSVACEIVEPETLERSVGKLQRLKDLRAR